MKKNKITFEEIDSLFVNLVQDSILEMQFTTAEKIISERINVLRSNIDLYRSFKFIAIKNNLEVQANSLLHMQCTLQSIHSVFLTFTLIRQNLNLKAWISLIDAYEYLDIAIKAKEIVHTHIGVPIDDSNGVFEIRRRILNIEKGLFPSHKVYNSSALIETLGKCSICKNNFPDCEHIEGNIYSGLYCQRIEKEILDVDHIAMVENPKDRRCVYTSQHNLKEIAVDIFSREPLEQSLNNNEFRGLVYYKGQLDIN